MQFLNVQKKIVLLPTYRGDTSRTHLWNVQPHSIYKVEELASNFSQADAFLFGDPQTFHVFKFLSEVKPDRTLLRQWETDLSDIDGCISLTCGKALVPRTPLQDAKVPILALTDALEDASFVPVGRSVDHYPRQGKFFDNRNVESKRCYLQAVLARDWLFNRGQQMFASTRPQAYYLAILRKPGEVAATLSGKACLQMLKDAGKPQASLALPAPQPASNKRKLALADIEGDDGEEPPKVSTRSALMDIEPDEGSQSSSSNSSYSGSRSSSESNSSGSHHSSKVGSSIDGDYDDEPEVPRRIEGRKTRVEIHKNSGDRGIRITCGLHGHSCRKFRSLTLQTERYGKFTATYFLGAWLRTAEREGANHGKYKPTDAEIKAYIQSL